MKCLTIDDQVKTWTRTYFVEHAIPVMSSQRSGPCYPSTSLRPRFCLYKASSSSSSICFRVGYHIHHLSSLPFHPSHPNQPKHPNHPNQPKHPNHPNRPTTQTILASQPLRILPFGKTMRFLSLLTTGLLLAFTSNAQAQCVQGCGNPRTCLRNFGSVSLDRCPGGANNRFCDCVGDFSCGTEGRGRCTSGRCSGTIQTGLCPFGDDFRCCLPKWEWNGRSERGRKGDKWARAEKKKNHEQGWDDNEGWRNDKEEWRNDKRMKEYVVWFGD